MAFVTSNGVTVPFDGEHVSPMTDSTVLRADPDGLRRRLDEDGYLLLRGVVDPTEVRRLRADYFSRFEASYFRAGTVPGDGIFSGQVPSGLNGHGSLGHPAHAFVRSPGWRDFVANPILTALAQDVLGAPCSVLPRQIVRQYDGSSRRASRAHTDHTYLDQGSGAVMTMWIPIGDCPLSSGPLVYLEGSHRMSDDELGELRAVTDRPADCRPLSHDLGWVAERSGRRWLWADFASGDVAIHSPHVVHASLDVRSPVMRLSADLRYVRDDGRPDPRWLTPWAGDDGN